MPGQKTPFGLNRNKRRKMRACQSVQVLLSRGTGESGTREGTKKQRDISAKAEKENKNKKTCPKAGIGKSSGPQEGRRNETRVKQQKWRARYNSRQAGRQADKEVDKEKQERATNAKMHKTTKR
jgi:hypothetical protein